MLIKCSSRYFKLSLLLLCLLNIFASLQLNINLRRKTNGDWDEFYGKHLQDFNKRFTGSSSTYHKMGDTDSKEVQFQQDILFAYKTLFPENENFKHGEIKIDPAVAKEFKIEEKVVLDQVRHNQIITSFKKLILAHIERGLHFGTEKNKIINGKKDTKTLWPHPVASIFGHGARTLFLIRKGIYDNFREYIFPQEQKLLIARETASHNVVSKGNEIFEEKILFQAGAEYIINKFGGVAVHFGMNIPFGGFGNLWDSKNAMIGNEGHGIPIKKEAKDTYKGDVNNLQSGHLYVRNNILDHTKYNSILLGLESEQPNFRGMFSSKRHDMLSALSSSSNKVAGGLKFDKIHGVDKDKVPNNYGGRVAVFDEMPNADLLKKIDALEERLQKSVWWILLSSNVFEGQKFIESYLMKENPAKELKDLVKGKSNKK